MDAYLERIRADVTIRTAAAVVACHLDGSSTQGREDCVDELLFPMWMLRTELLWMLSWWNWLRSLDVQYTLMGIGIDWCLPTFWVQIGFAVAASRQFNVHIALGDKRLLPVKWSLAVVFTAFIHT